MILNTCIHTYIDVCQNYLGGGVGGGVEMSVKNRGAVITSLQLAFRRRERNFTPYTIHYLKTPLAMKNNIGKHAHVKHLPLTCMVYPIVPGNL